MTWAIVTWPMRNVTMYSEPFRVRVRAAGGLEPDYGDVLLPDQVYSQGSPRSSVSR